jgi:hypothetical protein
MRVRIQIILLRLNHFIPGCRHSVAEPPSVKRSEGKCLPMRNWSLSISTLHCLHLDRAVFACSIEYVAWSIHSQSSRLVVAAQSSASVDAVSAIVVISTACACAGGASSIECLQNGHVLLRASCKKKKKKKLKRLPRKKKKKNFRSILPKCRCIRDESNVCMAIHEPIRLLHNRQGTLRTSTTFPNRHRRHCCRPALLPRCSKRHCHCCRFALVWPVISLEDPQLYRPLRPSSPKRRASPKRPTT